MKQVKDGVATDYTYGDDLLSQTVATGTNFYGFDELGSTKFLTDTAGNITDTYQYDAYGEITSKTGTTDKNYLYTGDEPQKSNDLVSLPWRKTKRKRSDDRSLNQYYLRARYYNQGVGRFTQMDMHNGFMRKPTSLNKYLYANAAPTINIDPSGEFGLAGLMVSLRTRASLSTMSYGAATNIGNVVIGGITRPLLTASQANGLAGMTLASLLSATAYNYCQHNENCKPQMPIILYGANYFSLSKHISDAQVGNGSNGVPLTPLLRRRRPAPKNSRNWLRTGLVRNECPTPRNGLGDCDEYPFNSTREGGKNNYLKGMVSLRIIDSGVNQAGGRQLLRMYNEDRTQDGKRFLALANPYFPASFYLTRKGKFRLF